MSNLFHASINNNLKIIEPKRTLSKNKYIGDYVFATSDKTLAVMYLATRGYATLMNSKVEQPYIVICADKTEYIENDEGGTIYELPSRTFTTSPQKELDEFELVSSESVIPLSKTVHDGSLQAMIDYGITVRFVNQQTFNSLIGNPRQAEIIQNLPIFTYKHH